MRTLAGLTILLALPHEPAIACTSGVSGVVLNELMVNPAGSDSGSEWVEILNVSGAPLDLENWQLESATSESGGYQIEHIFGASVLAHDAYWVLGGASVGDLDEVGAISLPNGSGADAVRLVDCLGVTIDTVIYGTDNSTDALLDDTGAVASSLAPVPGDGDALARAVDGVDSDDSGNDFSIPAAPTPGQPNDPLYVFADGFESADTAAWSSVTPPPDP